MFSFPAGGAGGKGGASRISLGCPRGCPHLRRLVAAPTYGARMAARGAGAPMAAPATLAGSRGCLAMAGSAFEAPAMAGSAVAARGASGSQDNVPHLREVWQSVLSEI